MGTQLTMLLVVLLGGTVILAVPRRSLDLEKKKSEDTETTNVEPAERAEEKLDPIKTTNSSALENDLLTAVENGNITAVNNLTSSGVNVNFNNGIPLNYAVTSANLEMINALIKAGADVNINQGTLLRNAAWGGHNDIVQAFLKAGAKQEYYGSALAEAANKGHAQIVKLLLDNGADPSNAESALKFAAENGNLETVDLLLKSGTNPTTDETGGSPLFRAVMEGHSDVVALLVEHGADVKRALTSNYWWDDIAGSSESYGNGWTVMHVAARFGQNMVDQLVQFGVDINAKDINGYTPLQVALQHKKYAVAQELLRLCANTTIENTHGETALDITLQANAQNSTNSSRLQSLMDRMTQEIPEVIASTPFTDQGIVELKDAFEHKLSNSEFLKTELKDTIKQGTDITFAAEKILEQQAAKNVLKTLEERNCTPADLARNIATCKCVPPVISITTTSTSTESPASSTTPASTTTTTTNTTSSSTTTTTERS